VSDRVEEPDGGGFAPALSEGEQQEADRRRSLRVDVVHEAVRQEGEEELRRPSSALAWSGLAAGLSMGASLVAVVNHAQVVAGGAAEA
jgi:formate-nitrite transporter family protein